MKYLACIASIIMAATLPVLAVPTTEEIVACFSQKMFPDASQADILLRYNDARTLLYISPYATQRHFTVIPIPLTNVHLPTTLMADFLVTGDTMMPVKHVMVVP
jgi:hypothetical protein